jgi:putative membrane protein
MVKESQMPRWLAPYFTAEDAEKLAARVRELEKSTSVEFVTMVVRRSTANRHVYWLLLLLIFATLIHFHSQFWGEYFPSQQTLMYLLELILAAGFSRLLVWTFEDFLTRLFTDERDMDQQVRLRAQVEFHNRGLTATAGRTGILIFISMAEKHVIVLADKSISEKLPESTWTETVAQLLTDIKKGEFAAGLTTAVEQVSKLVTPLFPAENENPDELTDELIIET